MRSGEKRAVMSVTPGRNRRIGVPHPSCWRRTVIGCLLIIALHPLPLLGSDNETCLDCHSDRDLETRRRGRTVSLFVDESVFLKSMHKELECIDCHEDADVEDFPHPEQLARVYCGDCHDDAQLDFDASIHGQALNRNAPYAPRCKDCHGVHDITSPKHPRSPAYRMNVPVLCGGCHREGAPVANTYEISEHNILENYSQSIHGEGLFQKGLVVTATCIDCHNAHLILPHSEPRASISPRRIARTCMRCHSKIEAVHTKVIRGELWEAAPGAIPACTDCHLPHKVRKETLALTISDKQCLKCHERPDVHKVADGDTVSVSVDKAEITRSVHRNMPCVKCHTDVDVRLRRPCETSSRVDCSSCHAKISEDYFASGHGRAHVKGIQEAPYCTSCHGDHDTKAHSDDTALTFRASVPSLCGDCHRAEGQASKVTELSQVDAITDYATSVHGRGLTEKGLLPSAICIDCHSSHLVLKHTDERSSVSRRNLPATCATCHRGIYKQYIKSVHFTADESDIERLPICADCHSSHTIGEVEKDKFVHEVTEQCGSCHSHLGETYLETMHGKAYQLGYLKAAKCSDCHGAHMILGGNDPNSTVGFRNIVKTCQQCHEDANMRFTGYLTHATHHDPVKYPILFYTYWAMTLLLVGVFSFFGVHMLLWMPRSFKQLRERRRAKSTSEPRYYIRRFTRTQRITHLFVIVSFLSLALTGMMLKFSHMSWATYVANVLGGVMVAGVIHRTAAVITFGYFAFHLMSLIRYKRKRRLGWRELVFGQNSLMFNRRDLRDFIGTLKWFFGAGPRPAYGRWTYWEKFDYLAVFWGVAIIGVSGLMLWFPELFTKIIPGSLINVATIVHSDEALLAVGFIFTIHFFNTHLRPEVFPMDTVVFTGIVPLDEYKKDRPAEYEELRKNGELRKRVVKKQISKRWRLAIRVFGFTFLSIGITLIGLIIYSVMFGYK
ncbi:MAG: cytochrome c3 family protein [Candidatus Krumholzibacteria bacterium]|nr:cytochrome c3 family protein [Candidatus Krumholzibacteria bacterium]